jgi:pilus retraction protein PilT
MIQQFEELILHSVQQGYSDVHVTGGHPVVFRKDGLIHFGKNQRWRHQDVDDLVRKLLAPAQVQMFQTRQSVDIARSIQHVRVRINIFNTTRGLSLAVRLLPGKVPTLEKLNLHPSFKDFCALRNGLVLVCGATGSGKSTTIAAMVEEINRSRASHVVSLEDPVEYRFLSRKSFVEQRELGAHMISFEQGLLDVLREDPDVIVVGELREPETMRLTLNAVESGHLVIASLHATDAEDALYRVCNSFSYDAQNIVRNQLASTLAVLIVQQLVFLPRVGFRVPVLSILRGSQSVKGIVRDNKLSQIEGAIQTGREAGMFTMENYRRDFVDRQTNFVSPSEIFRPSLEATPEIVYRCPLVDCPPGTPGTAAPPARQTYSMASASPPSPQPMPDTAYVIDGDASVEEVLAQIRKNDSEK